MTERTYPRQANDDEIDLIEFLHELWMQKMLIAAVALVVVMIALAYTLISKPVYSANAVIAPAPVNAFGLIAGDIGVRQLQASKSAISIGTDLADDALALVVKNFESAAIRKSFNSRVENSDGYSVQVKKGRLPFESISISVSSMSAVGAKEYLDGFMAYVSGISAAQLNEYFQALSVTHTIQPESLYLVEQMPEVPDQPIKPKKPLVLALGLVLGGMLGVFIALIRLMLRKRSAKVI